MLKTYIWDISLASHRDHRVPILDSDEEKGAWKQGTPEEQPGTESPSVRRLETVGRGVGSEHLFHFPSETVEVIVPCHTQGTQPRVREGRRSTSLFFPFIPGPNPLNTHTKSSLTCATPVPVRQKHELPSASAPYF